MYTSHFITIPAADIIASIIKDAEAKLAEQGLGNMTIDPASFEFKMNSGGELVNVTGSLHVRPKESVS